MQRTNHEHMNDDVSLIHHLTELTEQLLRSPGPHPLQIMQITGILSDLRGDMTRSFKEIDNLEKKDQLKRVVTTMDRLIEEWRNLPLP